ncbi:hypothetical protein [Paenibacillus alvei]|uniref:hypothetical protein n=1 Tax=Paenibacillus alvei TaxID=44250 RepID=UPI0018CF025B|nr:hypothetical protein [Paenibacillus alvei]MBG9735809.1 hypothetical protein [Paenibacillus alvei]MBG9743459.1 hypothetical protein [Paenibacillus alvei]
MNKPTIPNEVADAIEHLRNSDVFDPAYTNEDIVSGIFDPSMSSTTFATLRTIPFDPLMAALVNGYERELTEEQRAHADIRREYERHIHGRGKYETEGKDFAYADGMMYAVVTLGIQIEGVNA